MLQRILDGNGKKEDLDLLLSVSEKIEGNTICALGDAAAAPVVSFINNFRDEFEYYIKNGKSILEGEHNLIEEATSV
jgi:NADH-quinone oxidoreductase subunit F